MAATTMPSTTSLFNRLKKDFPEFRFEQSDEFRWSPSNKTVYLDTKDENNQPFSLHELSHALLGHEGYLYDVDLIKIERDAWQHAATELAGRYGVTVSEQLIQDNLDTYREWLHSRSKCPECDATGLQKKDHTYRCIGCGANWHANEARICSLRRYAIHTK